MNKITDKINFNLSISKSSAHKRQRLPKKAGAVIPIVAVGLAALLAILALTIDSARYAIHREQINNYTRSMALAALSGFYDDRDSPYHTRIVKAQQKVTAIQLPNTLLANKGHNLGVSQVGIKLEFGIWLPSSDDSAGLTCTGASCFKPDSSMNRPSAVRVSGLYSSNTGSFFAERIFGKSLFDIRSEAVAVLTPRKTCFLVDMSNSMTRETHPRWNSTQTVGGALQCRAATITSTGCQGCGNFYAYRDFTPALINDPPTVPSRFQQECGWNALYNATSNGSYIPRATTEHLSTDYRLRLLFNDNDRIKLAGEEKNLDLLHPQTAMFPLGTEDQFYRIDSFMGNRAGAFYRGAEPLNFALQALRDAVSEYRARTTRGDRICVIFFDSELEWPRIIIPTDNFDYVDNLAQAFDDDVDPIVDDPANPTVARNTDGFYSPVGKDRLARMGIFPKTSRFSNYRLAISTALALFQADATFTGGVKAPKVSQSMVVIGDWLANCVNRTGSPCDNTYDTYLAAMNEIETMADTMVSANAITPIHVMMIGSHVVPHTLFYESEEMPGYCMSPREARRHTELPSTFGAMWGQTYDWRGKFNLMVSGARFWWEGATYRPKRICDKTRGVWAPISLLDTGGRVSGGGSPYAPDGRRGNGCGGYFWENDVFGRNPTQQVREYVQEILGVSPYRIVYAVAGAATVPDAPPTSSTSTTIPISTSTVTSTSFTTTTFTTTSTIPEA